MQKETNPFICLVCGASLNQTSPDFWDCVTCRKRYPVVNGIPLLVRESQAHETEIKEAQRVKPGWYMEEQPSEQVSPWRHHIKKRRLYIEKALHGYLSEHNQAKTDRLLDLGCGDGNHLSYLQNYTYNLYGSDYNVVRLARAKMRGLPARLFLANILDYPTQDRFFDVIFFNHVLEHIPEDTLALSNVWRILKPGGLFILGIPNEGAWWWQMAYRFQPDIRRSTDHVHFYTADIISQRVKKAGFEIRTIHPLGWGPPHWGLDSRIRKYRWVDDGFEIFGKVFFPSQASSLYVLAIKPEEI